MIRLSLLSVGVVGNGWPHAEKVIFFHSNILLSEETYLYFKIFSYPSKLGPSCYNSVSAHKTLESPSLNLVSFLKSREFNGK